MLHLQNR
jgi:hypothetical protein